MSSVAGTLMQLSIPRPQCMGPLEESVAALGPPALPGNRCRDSGPGSPAATPFGAQQLKQLRCAPVWRVPASQSGALQSSLSLLLQYQATVPENEVGVLVARLSVSDRDKQGSPAWQAKYKIVRGNEGGFFTITTDPNNNNGLLKTSQVSCAHPAPAPYLDVTLKMLRPRGTAPGVLSCTASPSCMHPHSPQERKPARLSPPLLSGCRSTIPSRGCPGELPVLVPRALLRASPSPGRYSSVWGRRGFPSATPEPTLLRLTLLNLFPALLRGGRGESLSGRTDSGL